MAALRGKEHFRRCSRHFNPHWVDFLPLGREKCYEFAFCRLHCENFSRIRPLLRFFPLFFFFFPLLARFPTHLLLIFFFLSLPRFLARSMLIRSIYLYEFVLSLFLSRMKIDRENSSRDKFPGVFIESVYKRDAFLFSCLLALFLVNGAGWMRFSSNARFHACTFNRQSHAWTTFFLRGRSRLLSSSLFASRSN